MIPNSSNISGSSFATPLNNLSTESAIFLPRAIEAFLATSVNPSICLVSNPEVKAIAADLKATSVERAPSVISFMPSAICIVVRPAAFPKKVKPSISV